MIDVKICNECKIDKPATIEFFGKSIKSKDGLNSICKECSKIKRKLYYENNKDKFSFNRRKRRYKKYQLLDTLTKEEWEECLKYFNYKDAYTGLDLYDLSKDHAVPVIKNGDNIKENIVPCNKEINSSKNDTNLLEWYRMQPFYSEFRLQKILKWMGDYVQYLAKPNNISFENIINKRSQYFKITLPDGTFYTRNIKYFKSSNTLERIEILNNVVFNRWEEYFYNNWIDDEIKIYNSTKQILDRCATFLISGHDYDNKDYSSLNNVNIKNINNNETVFTSLDDNIKKSIGIEEGLNNKEKVILNDDFIELPLKVDKRVKKKKDYRDTIFHKMHKIYITEDRNIQNIKLLKNKDIKYKSYNIKDINTKVKIKNILPPNNVTDENGFIDEEKLKKWNNSYAKNVIGDYIYDVEYKKIKANKNGLIDKNRLYISQWCAVDTENIFKFKNNKYKIDESYKQYSVGKDNQCEMDKILCFEQDNNIYFFDMNINQLTNNLIAEVK